MYPRVKNVQPLENYLLKLTFENDEVRIFDVAPYLNKGIFKELQNKTIFNALSPFMRTIKWPNDQDFCPIPYMKKVLLSHLKNQINFLILTFNF
jgi:hypothetical protein